MDAGVITTERLSLTPLRPGDADELAGVLADPRLHEFIGGRPDTLEAVGDRVRVRVTGTVPVVAEVTPAAAAEIHLADGGPVWASVKATEVTVYPA